MRIPGTAAMQCVRTPVAATIHVGLAVQSVWALASGLRSGDYVALGPAIAGAAVAAMAAA